MPLILAIIFLLIFSSLFVFLYKKINTSNQETEQKTLVWETEMIRRENIKSLNRSLEEIKNSRLNLETHFAQSSDVVPFLDTLEKLDTKVGVLAEVGSVDTGKDSTALVVTLKATGRFESIYKFLMLLENFPYELDFLSMDLHKDIMSPSVKDQKWEVLFKLQLLTFIP